MAAVCLLFSAGLLLFGDGSLTAEQEPESAAAPERTLQGGNEAEQTALELLPEEKLDLNSATAEELQKLPGIGEVLSRAIVDYREEHGPFRSVEDLLLVPGIGEARLDEIRDLVTAEG
jgi:competence protein ComEA